MANLFGVVLHDVLLPADPLYSGIHRRKRTRQTPPNVGFVLSPYLAMMHWEGNAVVRGACLAFGVNVCLEALPGCLTPF